MDNEYIIINTSFDNFEEANSISNILLKKRLVSRCEIININSSYYWKDSIINKREFLLKMISKKNLYKSIEKEILNLHSYKIPQIIMFNIDGSKDYLKWIDDKIKKD